MSKKKLARIFIPGIDVLETDSGIELAFRDLEKVRESLASLVEDFNRRIEQKLPLVDLHGDPLTVLDADRETVSRVLWALCSDTCVRIQFEICEEAFEDDQEDDSNDPSVIKFPGT